ncbi:uncharacterized protein LOC129228450 [Uloborus diversus]|uniref:uncharacterized protein LOC129228450 n=1 Tax=Uloborus diversus TaxID=327109 RepID=UPI00240A073E|nr:uncharacterized protein LOC129228450 [Uloborus diversus]
MSRKSYCDLSRWGQMKRLKKEVATDAQRKVTEKLQEDSFGACVSGIKNTEICDKGYGGSNNSSFAPLSQESVLEEENEWPPVEDDSDDDSSPNLTENSYSDAIHYLRMAEDTSSLETEDEDRPRKKIRSRKFAYSSEEENSETFSPPKKPAGKKVEVDQYPPPYNFENLPTSPQAASQRILSVSDSRREKAVLPSPDISCHRESCSSRSTDFGKIVAWMGDVSEKILTLNDLLRTVLQNQEELKNLAKNKIERELDCVENFERFQSLPLCTDEEFIKLNEEMAKDKEVWNSMAKVLISVGGKDMRTHINNMLRRVLADEVAELYSLSGKSLSKNVTKKQFLTTELTKTIFYACRRVYKDQGTDSVIKLAIGDWLNQAKVRRTRRMQRQEQNVSEL